MQSFSRKLEVAEQANERGQGMTRLGMVNGIRYFASPLGYVLVGLHHDTGFAGDKGGRRPYPAVAQVLASIQASTNAWFWMRAFQRERLAIHASRLFHDEDSRAIDSIQAVLPQEVRDLSCVTPVGTPRWRSDGMAEWSIRPSSSNVADERGGWHARISLYDEPPIGTSLDYGTLLDDWPQ